MGAEDGAPPFCVAVLSRLLLLCGNCEILKDDLNGLQIKVPKERGGYVRDIRVVNCKMSQIKIITKITYNTGYEAASETPYIGDMEFVNLNMKDARKDRPAIVIDGFDGVAGNTTGIRFNNIRVADGATIALKDCAGISFHNVLTTEEKKPVYKVANAQGISH